MTRSLVSSSSSSWLSVSSLSSFASRIKNLWNYWCIGNPWLFYLPSSSSVSIPGNVSTLPRGCKSEAAFFRDSRCEEIQKMFANFHKYVYKAYPIFALILISLRLYLIIRWHVTPKPIGQWWLKIREKGNHRHFKKSFRYLFLSCLDSLRLYLFCWQNCQ